MTKHMLPRSLKVPKSIRILAGTLVITALLLLAAGLLAPWIIGQKRAKDFIVTTLQEQAGLELHLEKPLSLRLLPRPSVTLEGVQISMSGKQPPLLEAERIDLALAVTPLFQGQVGAALIRLEKPRITLTRNLDGRLQLPEIQTQKTDSPPAKGEFAAFTPFTGAAIEIADGSLTYTDQAADEVWSLRHLDVLAEAAIQDDILVLPPADISFVVAESPLPLPQNAPIELHANAVYSSGVVDIHELGLRIMDSSLQLKAHGNNLFSAPAFTTEFALHIAPKDFPYEITDNTAADTEQASPAIDCNASLSGDLHTVTLNELVLALGQETLHATGALTLDARPTLQMQVNTAALSWRNVAAAIPMVGVFFRTGETAATAPLAPGELLSWTRDMQVDATVTVDAFTLQKETIRDVTLALQAGEGKLRLTSNAPQDGQAANRGARPVAHLAEGAAGLELEASIDEEATTDVHLQANLEGAELTPLISMFMPSPPPAEGSALAGLELTTRGDTWEKLMNNTSGHLRFAVQDGSITATQGATQEYAPLEFQRIEGDFTISGTGRAATEKEEPESAQTDTQASAQDHQ